MTILVLGCNGQLGRSLQHHLIPFGNIIALDRSQANLSHLSSLSKILQSYEPSVIINAAAYTAVDKAESEPELAQHVNTDAVQVLAEYSKKNTTLLIHYSTDYVFDGSKKAAYLETDETSPLNVYGTSKLKGEQVILGLQIPALIFRTSWLYSKYGHNFLNTILRLAREREHLNVVSDQIGSPTSVDLVAEITALALKAYMNGSLTSGLYHLSASGETHWCDFARTIVQGAIMRGLPSRLTLENIKAIPSSEYPTPAKRPANSCLNTDKLCTALNINLPDWRIHLEKTLDEYHVFEKADIVEKTI